MLSRITYDREHAAVRIEPHSASGRESLELDVLDFIARLTAQIPRAPRTARALLRPLC